MVAQVCRFYGLTPRYVMEESHWIVRAMYERIDKLSAIEDMRQATATAVGTGSMDKDQRKRTVNSWKGRAEAGDSHRTPSQSMAKLQAAGIDVGTATPGPSYAE